MSRNCARSRPAFDQPRLNSDLSPYPGRVANLCCLQEKAPGNSRGFLASKKLACRLEGALDAETTRPVAFGLARDSSPADCTEGTRRSDNRTTDILTDAVIKDIHANLEVAGRQP